MALMAGPVPKPEVRDNAAQTGASDARPIPGTPLASPPSYLLGGLASGPLYYVARSLRALNRHWEVWGPGAASCFVVSRGIHFNADIALASRPSCPPGRRAVSTLTNDLEALIVLLKWQGRV